MCGARNKHRCQRWFTQHTAISIKGNNLCNKDNSTHKHINKQTQHRRWKYQIKHAVHAPIATVMAILDSTLKAVQLHITHMYTVTNELNISYTHICYAVCVLMHKIVFASNTLEPNTRKVLCSPRSHQHNIVLLQCVPFTRDVRNHLLPIAEPDATALALS